MIPVARPSFGPEEEAAVRDVLRSGWVAQGPTTIRFENEFAGVIGSPHAIATSSCTTALHLAVLAAGVGPGDEVVLPSFTFPATANAVLYEGATPVLVDVDPATLNVDVDQVAHALTERTRAVIGVHLFGAACDIVGLRELCDDRGLFLIEDAACAVGTRIGEKMAGAFGDVACFSFHARKVVTCGEGGMLTTPREETAELLKSLRTHGVDRAAEQRHAEGAAPPPARYVRVGYNYRLSDLQAAVGIVQLGKLEALVKERIEIADRYDAALGALPGLRLPPRTAGSRHSFQSYVVVVEPDAPRRASSVMDSLAERGVSTRVGTYAIHDQPYFESSADLPHSSYASEQSIALPMFNGLSMEDQNTVLESLREVWGVASRLRD